MEGFVDPDYVDVARVFRRVLRATRGGASVAVIRDGRTVVDLWGGVRDRQGNPWESDTVAMSYSTTKGVVATTLHRLADRGLVEYDAPVADYWPEFGAEGKGDITVRHLLGHGAGMHRMRGVVDSGHHILDWQTMTDALAAAPARWAPGERHGYHALTYGWLVGEVVRRVSGQAVRDAVRSEVAEPLGLDGLGIGAPPGEPDRMASLMNPFRGGARAHRVVGAMESRTGMSETVGAFLVPGIEDYLTPEVLADAEVPAVNGMFTARSLAEMYAAVIDPEREFLSPATVATATTVQMRGRDAIVGMPMRWRLGYHFVGTIRGTLPNGFGHFGFGGSGAFADPDSGVAFAFVTNRIGGYSPFADTRILRLSGAALGAAKSR